MLLFVKMASHKPAGCVVWQDISPRTAQVIIRSQEIKSRNLLKVNPPQKNLEKPGEKSTHMPESKTTPQGVYSDMYMTEGLGPGIFWDTQKNKYQENQTQKNKFMKITDPKK